MISPLLLDDFWSNPGIILVLILVCFGLVALLVFLLRKYVPFFKSDENESSRSLSVRKRL